MIIVDTITCCICYPFRCCRKTRVQYVGRTVTAAPAAKAFAIAAVARPSISDPSSSAVPARVAHIAAPRPFPLRRIQGTLEAEQALRDNRRPPTPQSSVHDLLHQMYSEVAVPISPPSRAIAPPPEDVQKDIAQPEKT